MYISGLVPSVTKLVPNGYVTPDCWIQSFLMPFWSLHMSVMQVSTRGLWWGGSRLFTDRPALSLSVMRRRQSYQWTPLSRWFQEKYGCDLTDHFLCFSIW